ncbi:WxL protein peptidoglycan domain-containing protein [Marmoricola sp. RAF53]|uniref:WxL protein peptidoglycan domain-containing protein n=1 Tax=Marmoricola sp. RAF53 TaxID=3233059 RepID=UPI003F971F0A
MKRLTALLGLCLTAVLVLLGPAATADDNGISVGLRPATAKGGDASRPYFEYEIPPRGKVIDYVAISNLRFEPVTVRLFGKDATTTTGSAYAVQTSDEAPTDVGSWIVPQKTRITVPARSEVVVPFQIGTPADAEPGDHAGAIVVSLLAKEPKPKGGTIVVDHRVGLRVLLRVPGDLTPALTVTGLKADWDGPGSVLGRGDTTVSYTVTNTGNLRLSATQGISLTRALGLPSIDATAPAIKEIQPGGSVQVRQVVHGVLGTGPMKAHVSVHPRLIDTKLKDITVKDATATTSFSAWPWLLIALVIALFLLGGAGWHVGRRRYLARKQAKAQTGGKYRAPASPDSRPDSDQVLVRGLTRALAGAGAVVLATLGVVLLGPAGPAAADTGDVWQGRPSVDHGTDNAPFDILTTGGCPLPGTNVVAFAYGNGFPKEGGVVVGNGDAGVDSRGAFRMPLVSTMAQIITTQPHPAPLAGVYKIELRCVSADLQKRTGNYVFAIRFTDPHHWKAEPPLTTAKGPVTTGSDDGAKAPSGDPSDAKAGGGQRAQAAPGAAGAPSQAELETAQKAAQKEAQKRAAELAGVQEPDASTSADGTNWWLVGGGVAVLAATGVLLFRRSRA